MASSSAKGWGWYSTRVVAWVVSLSGLLAFFWPLASALGNGIVTALSGTGTQTAFVAALPVYVTLPWGLLTALGLVMLVQMSRAKRAPVTVIASEFHDTFLDATGRSVRCERTQIFRANEPGVTSYPIGMAPTFGGHIPRDSIEVRDQSQNDGPNLRLMHGSDKTGWKLIHRFEDGLNFNLLVALTPTWVLRALATSRVRGSGKLMVKPFFENLLHVRTVSYRLNDEYHEVEYPSTQLENPNSVPQHNIWFILQFGKYAVEEKSVTAHLISDRRVHDKAPVDWNKVDRSVSYRLPRLSAQSFRIAWRRDSKQSAAATKVAPGEG